MFPSVLTLIGGTKGQGELAVAQGKPLPPFERWSFGEERYMQFIQDQVLNYFLSGLERFIVLFVLDFQES